MRVVLWISLVGQNNGILLAYELEDVSPCDHFFQLGMPGRCPPYPEVGGVVIVRNSSDRSFSVAVVRSVSTPTFTTDSQVEEESKRKAIAVGPLMQQDYFVGMVYLGMLEVYGRVHGTFKRYRASGITGTRSWYSIERILDDPQVTIITMGNLLNGYGKTWGMLMVSSEGENHFYLLQKLEANEKN